MKRLVPVLLFLAFLHISNLFAANATINLDQPNLTFSGTVNGADPAPQTVNLTNPAASSTLSWSIASDQPWLTVTPISGTTTTERRARTSDFAP
jgi:hypothetical protein